MNISIDENVIFFRINKLYRGNMTPSELYETTRGVWRIGKRRELANYAFSVYKNEIIEVFKIIKWFPAGTLKYNTRSKESIDREGRWEFEGELAEQPIRNKYIGKSIEEFVSRRAQNPAIYHNC